MVDASKMPVVNGLDLWYPITCKRCNSQVGLLANVESVGPYDGNFNRRQQELWRKAQQSH